MDQAIEEILRWHPPVLTFRRTATRDHVLNGAEIAAGDKVVVYHCSAHRDERRVAGLRVLPCRLRHRTDRGAGLLRRRGRILEPHLTPTNAIGAVL